MSATLTPDVMAQEVDEGYRELEAEIAAAFGSEAFPVFETDVDADALWLAYLDNLPSNRQHYNCNCCRAFITRYAGLVHIVGSAMVPLLNKVKPPRFFNQSIAAMCILVAKSRVKGVFVSELETWGTPKSDKGWTHLSAKNPCRHTSKVISANQRASELTQDYILIQTTEKDYTIKQLEDALAILNSQQFPGYEKGVHIAEWYLSLRRSIKDAGPRYRSNLIWSAVAHAPPGYAHLKNGMVGTLLDDLAAGKSFEQCKRAWSAKMHPLQYQRPTAPVSSGQVAVAEKLVEKMGIANSLKRKFASLADLKYRLWTPVPEYKHPGGGVFGHLLNKPAESSVSLPNQNMTWAKFSRDVLPNASKMEIDCPSRGGYIAIVTAEDPESPPILQWDSEGNRNQASHYFYHGGSTAFSFNLSAGWNEVVQVSTAPHGNFIPHFKKFIVFSIKGAYDKNPTGGCGLFPEFMRSELREVRSVIEAYSNKAKPSGQGDAHGLAFGADTPVRVRVNGGAIYTLDRWE